MQVIKDGMVIIRRVVNKPISSLHGQPQMQPVQNESNIEPFPAENHIDKKLPAQPTVTNEPKKKRR